jgi:hypothetical protein
MMFVPLHWPLNASHKPLVPGHYIPQIIGFSP